MGLFIVKITMLSLIGALNHIDRMYKLKMESLFVNVACAGIFNMNGMKPKPKVQCIVKMEYGLIRVPSCISLSPFLVIILISEECPPKCEKPKLLALAYDLGIKVDIL